MPIYACSCRLISNNGSISTLGKAKRGAKSRRVEENVTTFAIFEAVIKTDNKKGIVRLAPHMLFIDGYY